MYVQFTSCVYGARPKISQMNFPFPSSPPQKLREELIDLDRYLTQQGYLTGKFQRTWRLTLELNYMIELISYK